MTGKTIGDTNSRAVNTIKNVYEKREETMTKNVINMQLEMMFKQTGKLNICINPSLTKFKKILLA